jgi:hypothetical protein
MYSRDRHACEPRRGEFRKVGFDQMSTLLPLLSIAGKAFGDRGQGVW